MPPLRLPTDGCCHAAQTAQKSPETPPNGSGTVVRLSGRRKNPFQIRVNTRITKEGDDTQGVPFTLEELGLLWEHKDVPFVDTVLIYCYSGWRINELARMPLDDIDLEAKAFTGGLKNRYSRNRTVPIHSAVYETACGRPDPRFKSLNMIF